MSFNTKEFKELQAKWYRKLQLSGFKDIERNENSLYQPTKGLPMTIEETTQYYKLARTYLEVAEFESDLELAVWFLHSQGLTGAEMTKVLSTSTSTISRILTKHDKRMLAR